MVRLSFHVKSVGIDINTLSGDVRVKLNNPRVTDELHLEKMQHYRTRYKMINLASGGQKDRV